MAGAARDPAPPGAGPRFVSLPRLAPAAPDPAAPQSGPQSAHQPGPQSAPKSARPSAPLSGRQSAHPTTPHSAHPSPPQPAHPTTPHAAHPSPPHPTHPSPPHAAHPAARRPWMSRAGFPPTPPAQGAAQARPPEPADPFRRPERRPAAAASARDAHQGAARAVPAARGSALDRAVVVAFLLSLIVPMFFHLGPLRLSPYRLFLLVLFVPLMLMWLQGRAGRIRAPDLLVLGFGLWGALTLQLSNSGATIESVGIWMLETMGAYLVGRVMVRDAAGVATAARTYVLMVAALTPFLVFENLTERRLLSELIAPFGSPFYDYQMEKRLGLERAQGPFEHPILLGMFSSMALTASLMAFRGPKAVAMAALGMLATFSSLSSGAYTAVATQLFLLSWDRVLRAVRRRWLILLGLAAAGYVVVDLLSNRSPIAVFISYATFQPHTAYHRILIWEYGSRTVWANPLFGIGFGDWERAGWMSSSVDNFWLLIAMRHGLPGFLLIALAVGLVIAGVARALRRSPADPARAGAAPAHPDQADPDPAHPDPADPLRTRYAIMMGAICIAICTVHLWGATFAFFMFLVGAGACLAEPTPQARPQR